MDSIKNSGLGSLLRYLSQGKLFTYKEFQKDFIVPSRYLVKVHSKPTTLSSNDNEILEEEKDEENKYIVEPDSSYNDTSETRILVDWYGENDPENPRNWSLFKKTWIMLSMACLTTFIYMGSSIFIPGVEQIEKEFNTSLVKATLPLTVFIIGYGVGPMVLSPLSEHAPLGRNPLYLITLFLFVILQIPTAKSKSIDVLVGLRFLSGILASPALSTGAASLGDVFPSDKLYIGLVLWGFAACCGPAFGPLVGGVLVQLVNWRWTFWFMAIISATVFVVLFVFLPETNANTILHKRAARLRKVTGNENIKSEYEIDTEQNPRSFTVILIETLWRPIFIAFFEPIVFFLNLYNAFIYIIMNSWFEAFPIVFSDLYHFNTIETGLAYLSVSVGPAIGVVIYVIIFKYQVFGSRKNPPIERYLILGMYGSVFLPAGLFIFSWTSTASVHWIAPVIGAAVFGVGSIITFQSNFSYLGKGFPRYLASVFAGNYLVRALMASTFPLFAKSLFINLGSEKFPVGAGGSVLGAIGVVMIAIPFIFYRYGIKLRGRSKFAN